MTGKEADLMQVLALREKKAMLQETLRKKYPGCVCVSLGMNIPGPVKNNSSIRRGFLEGCRVLELLLSEHGWKILEQQSMEETAGCALILAVDAGDCFLVKREAVRLEEEHPLGRLFDIDVADADGLAVSREQVGAGRRRCLICREDAKVCGRNRTHGVKELQERTAFLLRRWEEREEEAMDSNAGKLQCTCSDEYDS